MFLGGRVAEEIVFGDMSTGAQNDLQMATDMARHMVTQYGMSERLGLATFEQAERRRRCTRRGWRSSGLTASAPRRRIDAEIAAC